MNSPLGFRRLPRWCLVLAASWTIAAPLRAQRMELTDSSATAVTVESADIKTEITGRIAVTTFDLVFRNPNGRQLEGTFVLPLLDGQSVTRFALDLNGRLREAVPVDKVQGRVVFEEIERRRVDPGLLEQTAGNNYRARIFPLPAGGTRRVVVAYQEDVVHGSAGATYRLNLDFPRQLKSFKLGLAVYAGNSAPQVRTTLGLDLPAWRDGQFMEVERPDFTAHGLLEVALPPLDRPRVVTGRHDNHEYFYAEAPIAVTPQPRPAPHVAGLLWDSSGSGTERDHAREFALLDAWFATVREVEIRLVRFRDQAEPAQTFPVKDGDWTALRAELEKTTYDGATALDGIADDSGVDEWLLFSDGLINYGATPASAKLPLHGAVHTILASPRADPVWLRSLAARQSGEFVNLLELAAAPAAARLRAFSPRVLHVDYNRTEASAVFPEPGAIVNEDPLVVAGVLRAGHATVRVRVGTSERDARTVELVVHSGENPGALAARGWATAKIAQLSLASADNRADLRRTSRDFGTVTADTSLIVLETVADYVRYDITPPDELAREWSAQRNFLARDERKGRDEHLESVVQAFRQRVAWWESSFPKDDPVAQSTAKDRSPALPIFTQEQLRGRIVPLAAAAGRPAPAGAAEEVVTLSPFEVSRDRSTSRAANTLAGTRIRGTPVTSGGLTASGDLILAGLAKASGEEKASPTAPTITLQRWSPDAAYLDHLKRATVADAYDVYLEERADHRSQPGFFLDVANFFFERSDAGHARRILSNLAELDLEDVALLRVLAHRLADADRPDLARPLFERVLALRPDEPQSHRDLALVCAELKHYQRAVDLLWEVVSQPWSARFPGIELIALSELNAIVATCGERLDVSQIDSRLRKNLPVQSRVILTWDTNDCDIDLWVLDPNSEMAKYNHPLTYQGGRMSQDFTQGYGPEEFALRSPKPGLYRVNIDYYGDRRQTALGPVTAQVRIITDFGTSAQQEKRVTVRLDQRKENLEVGSFEIGAEKISKKSRPSVGQ